MNRGILKQDDDFEEYSNIVVEHFSGKEGFMDLKTVISIKIWAYKNFSGWCLVTVTQSRQVALRRKFSLGHSGW